MGLFNISLRQMPAYMYFLCSRSEIKENNLGCGFFEKGVESVFHWFFDDYMKFIQEANWQIDEMEFMYNRLLLGHIKMLRFKYPGHMDFLKYRFKSKLINRKINDLPESIGKFNKL
jgi:hypothetical protein